MNQDVVVKQIRNVFRRDEGPAYAVRSLREAAILLQLNHPNVVRTLDILQPPKDREEYHHIYVVMETVYGTDLHGLLVRGETVFSEVPVRFMIYQCLTGLDYMHRGGLVHRDLKPQNILVRMDCAIKLCDFGFGRPPLLEDEASAVMAVLDKMPTEAETDPECIEIMKDYRKNKTRRLTSHAVTRWYRAPEICLLDFIYGEASDVWSMATIFGELVQLKAIGKRQPLYKSVASRLSPLAGMDKDNPDCPMIESVCAALGAPAEDDFPLASRHPATNEYLEGLRAKYPGPVEEDSFAVRFPAWTAEDTHIVTVGMKWSPDKRPTCAELITEPYFDAIRDEPAKYGNIAAICDRHPIHPVDGKLKEYISMPTLSNQIKKNAADDAEEKLNEVLLTPTPTALSRTVNPNPNRTVGHGHV